MPIAPPPAVTEARPPRRGTASIRYEAGRVDITANAVPHDELLGRLAVAASFSLELRGDGSSRVTLALDDVPLETVLPLLVGDRSYTAEWDFETEGAIHRLRRLVLGSANGARETPPAEAAATSRVDAPSGVADALERALADRSARGQPAERLLVLCDDPDPRVRMSAVVELAPESAALTRLRDLLENDPDPRVRAAATASLENGEGSEVRDALLGALDDPDAEVVLEVIDSIEFAGDETWIAPLKPLVEHRDPRVSEAAAAAIGFLE